MRRLLLPALLVSACHFDTTTNSGVGPDSLIDADPTAPDADPTAPDADPTAPDASTIAFCAWEYDPTYFDPCVDPPVSLTPLDLNMPSSPGDSPPYTYDTMSDSLRDPQMNSVGHTSTVVDGKRILWTSNFAIASGARLRVVGSMPLVIASKTNINIDGVLNVASFFSTDDVALVGAGSEPSACMIDPSGRGEDCEHGGAGGGGGAFSGNGGTGGKGALNHNDCDSPDEFLDGATESTGGAGGGLAALPAILRGGCAGLEGGEGNGGATFGIGAPGGGAVHLTAVATLGVTGIVHAGGAGGRKATGGRAAGGGGGSGGMIGLEATAIDLGAGAIISANGGGGGGGGNGGGAQDGENAPISGAQAIGGAPESQGTAGGDGGWVGAAEGGSPTPTATRGGGGGGGGAGYILTYQDTTPTLSATISPAAIAVTPPE